MLTIYGANLSSPSNKVRFTANAIGLDYTYRAVKLREGENKQEWFLKINPFGKIPAIDDDGFTLFESNAICRYLLSKHKSPLYPTELKQRALIDQWVDFGSMHIGMSVSRLTWNRVFAPMLKVPVDEQSLKDGLNFLDKFLPITEAHLKKNKFFAGPQMTYADINILSGLDPAEASGLDLTKYTALTSWRNNLKSQSFYTKCHKDYADALKAMMPAAAAR